MSGLISRTQITRRVAVYIRELLQELIVDKNIENEENSLVLKKYSAFRRIRELLIQLAHIFDPKLDLNLISKDFFQSERNEKVLHDLKGIITSDTKTNLLQLWNQVETKLGSCQYYFETTKTTTTKTTLGGVSPPNLSPNHNNNYNNANYNNNEHLFLERDPFTERKLNIFERILEILNPSNETSDIVRLLNGMGTSHQQNISHISRIGYLDNSYNGNTNPTFHQRLAKERQRNRDREKMAILCEIMDLNAKFGGIFKMSVLRDLESMTSSYFWEVGLVWKGIIDLNLKVTKIGWHCQQINYLVDDCYLLGTKSTLGGTNNYNMNYMNIEFNKSESENITEKIIEKKRPIWEWWNVLGDGNELLEEYREKGKTLQKTLHNKISTRVDETKTDNTFDHGIDIKEAQEIEDFMKALVDEEIGDDALVDEAKKLLASSKNSNEDVMSNQDVISSKMRNGIMDKWNFNTQCLSRDDIQKGLLQGEATKKEISKEINNFFVTRTWITLEFLIKSILTQLANARISQILREWKSYLEIIQSTTSNKNLLFRPLEIQKSRNGGIVIGKEVAHIELVHTSDIDGATAKILFPMSNDNNISHLNADQNFLSYSSYILNQEFYELQLQEVISKLSERILYLSLLSSNILRDIEEHFHLIYDLEEKSNSPVRQQCLQTIEDENQQFLRKLVDHHESTKSIESTSTKSKVYVYLRPTALTMVWEELRQAVVFDLKNKWELDSIVWKENWSNSLGLDEDLPKLLCVKTGRLVRRENSDFENHDEILKSIVIKPEFTWGGPGLDSLDLGNVESRKVAFGNLEFLCRIQYLLSFLKTEPNSSSKPPTEPDSSSKPPTEPNSSSKPPTEPDSSSNLDWYLSEALEFYTIEEFNVLFEELSKITTLRKPSSIVKKPSSDYYYIKDSKIRKSDIRYSVLCLKFKHHDLKDAEMTLYITKDEFLGCSIHWIAAKSDKNILRLNNSSEKENILNATTIKFFWNTLVQSYIDTIIQESGVRNLALLQSFVREMREFFPDCRFQNNSIPNNTNSIPNNTNNIPNNTNSIPNNTNSIPNPRDSLSFSWHFSTINESKFGDFYGKKYLNIKEFFFENTTNGSIPIGSIYLHSEIIFSGQINQTVVKTFSGLVKQPFKGISSIFHTLKTLAKLESLKIEMREYIKEREQQKKISNSSRDQNTSTSSRDQNTGGNKFAEMKEIFDSYVDSIIEKTIDSIKTNTHNSHNSNTIANYILLIEPSSGKPLAAISEDSYDGDGHNNSSSGLNRSSKLMWSTYVEPDINGIRHKPIFDTCWSEFLEIAGLVKTLREFCTIESRLPVIREWLAKSNSDLQQSGCNKSDMWRLDSFLITTRGVLPKQIPFVYLVISTSVSADSTNYSRCGDELRLLEKAEEDEKLRLKAKEENADGDLSDSSIEEEKESEISKSEISKGKGKIVSGKAGKDGKGGKNKGSSGFSSRDSDIIMDACSFVFGVAIRFDSSFSSKDTLEQIVDLSELYGKWYNSMNDHTKFESSLNTKQARFEERYRNFHVDHTENSLMNVERFKRSQQGKTGVLSCGSFLDRFDGKSNGSPYDSPGKLIPLQGAQTGSGGAAIVSNGGDSSGVVSNSGATQLKQYNLPANLKVSAGREFYQFDVRSSTIEKAAANNSSTSLVKDKEEIHESYCLPLPGMTLGKSGYYSMNYSSENYNTLTNVLKSGIFITQNNNEQAVVLQSLDFSALFDYLSIMKRFYGIISIGISRNRHQQLFLTCMESRNRLDQVVYAHEKDRDIMDEEEVQERGNQIENQNQNENQVGNPISGNPTFSWSSFESGISLATLKIHGGRRKMEFTVDSNFWISVRVGDISDNSQEEVNKLCGIKHKLTRQILDWNSGIDKGIDKIGQIGLSGKGNKGNIESDGNSSNGKGNIKCASQQEVYLLDENMNSALVEKGLIYDEKPIIPGKNAVGKNGIPIVPPDVVSGEQKKDEEKETLSKLVTMTTKIGLVVKEPSSPKNPELEELVGDMATKKKQFRFAKSRNVREKEWLVLERSDLKRNFYVEKVRKVSRDFQRTTILTPYQSAILTPFHMVINCLMDLSFKGCAPAAVGFLRPILDPSFYYGFVLHDEVCLSYKKIEDRIMERQVLGQYYAAMHADEWAYALWLKGIMKGKEGKGKKGFGKDILDGKGKNFDTPPEKGKGKGKPTLTSTVERKVFWDGGR